MKRILLTIAATLMVVVSLGLAYARATSAGADSLAQECDTWVDQTNARVQDARVLLYPSDRPDAFAGTVEEAAQELLAIYQEQLGGEPPDGAGQLNDDLLEAMAVGAEGLATNSADAPLQIVFAKSIIYNADARLLLLAERC